MKSICLQMSRKALLVIALVISLSFPALAQKITVSGTVVDPTGEPLIGASVLAKGTTNGTATDLDGNYRLEVAPNATLVFSYVGYNTQEIAVNGQSTVNCTMSENSVMLKEVVAIGYGVVKKSDATGSVAVIKPDDIEAGVANSVQDLLVGASPGVTVTTNGGNPTGGATIRIRGGSSISANNNPLIVIDGVPQSDTDLINGAGVNAMAMLNPNDIESMTILKDASATAIYGSRASNGVIIITTKKGTSGRPKVTFAANWHLAKARKTYKVLDGAAYRDLANQIFAGSEAANFATLYENNTDWQDEVLRTAFSQDYNLSVSGTAKWLPYRVSASWANNEGIIRDNSVQRTTVGISLSPKFFNGKLSVNANVTGTYLKLQGYGNEGAVGNAVSYNPTAPTSWTYPMTSNSVGMLYNGLWYDLDQAAQGQGKDNPLNSFVNYKKRAETFSSTGNLQIDYALHFLPELHLNLNLGYEVSENNQRTWNHAGSRGQWLDNNLTQMGSTGAGTFYKWYQLNRNTLLNFYLNYRKDFEAIQSNLDVMAGYEWQRFSYLGHQNTYIATRGYMNTNGVPNMVGDAYDLQWDENSAENIGKLYPNSENRWAAPLQLISFFGRLNYSYRDTYLFTFTIRDDGSSRFSKDNRWGVFPSLALGWKISNEPVFENLRTWWNELKMRAGWGMTGQQDVSGYFPYMPVYGWSTGGYNYPGLSSGYNGEWAQPLYPNAYNADLKWETTTTWNVGLDFGFLNNRINASVDWYLRQTKDLLYSAPIFGLGTAAQITSNIGNMRNTGVEFTLSAKPIVTKDFTWSTGFNWAFNDSKVTSLTGDSASDATPADGLPAGTGGNLTWFTVDEAPRSFRVFEQVYDDNGDPIPNVFVDQNGDGVITDDDLIYYHNPAPRHTFSWNNTFNWKNWDLGFTLRANLENYVYSGPRADRTLTSQMWQYGWNNVLQDEFMFESASEHHFLSSYFVENASFLRCDNISLGYTFDNIWNGRMSIRVFGVVENPFVITKYSGNDPEVFNGIDSSVYPNPTTYTLGVVCNF